MKETKWKKINQLQQREIAMPQTKGDKVCSARKRKRTIGDGGNRGWKDNHREGCRCREKGVWGSAVYSGKKCGRAARMQKQKEGKMSRENDRRWEKVKLTVQRTEALARRLCTHVIAIITGWTWEPRFCLWAWLEYVVASWFNVSVFDGLSTTDTQRIVTKCNQMLKKHMVEGM